MENASKALIIAGGILISMLVASIGVYLFTTYSDSSSSYEKTLQATQIQKFNANFLKFEGRKDITIYEIISLTNFVKQYNEQKEVDIKISIPGYPNLVENMSGEDKIIKLIEASNEKKEEFECKEITDTNYFSEGSEKGKIKMIEFVISN